MVATVFATKFAAKFADVTKDEFAFEVGRPRPRLDAVALAMIAMIVVVLLALVFGIPAAAPGDATAAIMQGP